MRLTALAAAAAGALLVATLNPAAAQDRKPAASQTKAPYSKSQLDQFVNAAIDVYRINARHEARWLQATEPAAKAQIRAEAKAEQEAAVRKHGLTVQAYNDILVAAKTDKALNDEIAGMIRAKSPG